VRRRAVFLDRDGTLVEESGYLDRLERLEFFPYTVDAVRALNHAGLAVVLITNQAGVAKGMFDEQFVADTHDRISAHLLAGGARLDGIYYCPHHPDATVARYRLACDCRKPEPGLLRRAAADLDLDLTRSFVVGDRSNDVGAGRAVGARTVLVRTGYGTLAERAGGHSATFIADTLIDAVAWILQQA
jgi:D-glycero-D-manno-heptose 1,7-bisphosphate phosphatase